MQGLRRRLLAGGRTEPLELETTPDAKDRLDMATVKSSLDEASEEFAMAVRDEKFRSLELDHHESLIHALMIGEDLLETLDKCRTNPSLAMVFSRHGLREMAAALTERRAWIIKEIEQENLQKKEKTDV
jgi:hypothetical protein